MISLHIFFISIIQGFTEFLPISSSAHLIILPKLMLIQDQGIIIDITAHLGSLFALLLFFREDTKSLIKGVMYLMNLNTRKKEVRFLLKLVVASIPVIILGLFIKILNIDAFLRSLEIIGWTMIIFGFFLYFSDRLGKEKKNIVNWSYNDALVIGFFQAIALIPGVSRSGITISGSRFLGYDRYSSIRLSMLMSIPTIIASGILLTPDLFKESNEYSFAVILISFLLSFLTSFLSLLVLVKYIYKFHFTPYIIYRISLGFFLLWFVYN